MLHHISFGVADLERAAAFYDAVLAPLGGARIMDFGNVIGYGLPQRPTFWLGPLTTGEPNREIHIAFQAANHNWFRLKDYRVSPAQKWTVYFQHEGPAGANPITPFLLFGFVQGRSR